MRAVRPIIRIIIDICENTLLLKRVYCGMFNIFLPADDEATIIIKNVSGTGHLCVSLRFRFVYLIGTVSHVRRKNIHLATLAILLILILLEGGCGGNEDEWSWT